MRSSVRFIFYFVLLCLQGLNWLALTTLWCWRWFWSSDSSAITAWGLSWQKCTTMYDLDGAKDQTPAVYTRQSLNYMFSSWFYSCARMMPAWMELRIRSHVLWLYHFVQQQCLSHSFPMNENEPNADFMGLRTHVTPANLYSHCLPYHVLWLSL